MKKSDKKQSPIKLSAKDLLLGDDCIDQLRSIEHGQVVFEPDAGSVEALERFQQIVKVLRMLEGRRCISEISSLNLVNEDGHVCIDRVRVSGGLTAKGRVVLAHYEAKAKHLHNEAA